MKNLISTYSAKKKSLLASGSTLALAALVSLASCTKDHGNVNPGNNIQPTGPKPAWGPNIKPQMQAIIEEMARLDSTPLYTLTPQQARTKPTVKDAVNSLLSRNNISAPNLGVEVTQRNIPGANGASIQAVMYKPQNTSGNLPVIVYYHGGGWVIASPEVYEASAMALAHNVGAIVVSIEYRKAPENKFPTAHMDTYAAYKWVRQNATSFSGDTSKVAVAGESAGGNMAINVSMMARDEKFPMPIHQLVVYPVANNDLTTASYQQYANAKPLSKPLVEWFVDKYFNTMADGDSKYISLVDVADLRSLPPVTIIAAQIDPLLTEGEQLSAKLKQAGVSTEYRMYEGVTHEFFGTYAIEPSAKDAQDYAASRLKSAFGK
ncbi:lipase [Siphonobacter sp. BAB-5405]|uniref:alpha/beta hydrolase n=1 Tax=Siphonobacter sp. BAB-5405 TaxID=1864825 RepID=UPI000C80DED2|nr:alpha/beta hydrolase [Siphonobacter sp. BAB-5405]PMD96209.1 lipase [Siphonobacter sp. BAB-5405]